MNFALASDRLHPAEHGIAGQDRICLATLARPHPRTPAGRAHGVCPGVIQRAGRARPLRPGRGGGGQRVHVGRPVPTVRVARRRGEEPIHRGGVGPGPGPGTVAVRRAVRREGVGVLVVQGRVDGRGRVAHGGEGGRHRHLRRRGRGRGRGRAACDRGGGRAARRLARVASAAKAEACEGRPVVGLGLGVRVRGKVGARVRGRG